MFLVENLWRQLFYCSRNEHATFPKESKHCLTPCSQRYCLSIHSENPLYVLCDIVYLSAIGTKIDCPLDFLFLHFIKEKGGTVVLQQPNMIFIQWSILRSFFLEKYKRKSQHNVRGLLDPNIEKTGEVSEYDIDIYIVRIENCQDLRLKV